MLGSKKKIVHLCLGNFYIDGYSYQENMLPKYHVKMGYDVTVIASLVSFNTDGKYCLLDSEKEYQTSDGYKVIRMDYKKGFLRKIYKRFRFYTKTYELLESEHPNIIFVHNTSFGDAIYVKKYLKKHPCVAVYADSHADWVNSARNFLSMRILHQIVWRHYTSVLLPYCKKIYGVLPVRCDFLHKIYHVPLEKIELLPLGVDDDAIPVNRKEIRVNIREKLGIKENDVVIITGGKIDIFKNIHYLMQAVSEIDDEKLHLIVFGTVVPELKEYFESLLFNRIHYVGWCNSKQVIDYMISADVACFPGTHSTLWEEAIGLSLPCIFKDWEGMHHVDINGNCLFLQDDNIEGIKTALLNILDNGIYEKMFLKAQFAATSFKYSEISKKAIGLL